MSVNDPITFARWPFLKKIILVCKLYIIILPNFYVLT